MAEDLDNPLPPSPEQIALRRAGKGFVSTSFGGFQLTGIPKLDEQRRESRKAELVNLDARVARAATLEAELVTRALEEKRYIRHAPGIGEGRTHCGLDISCRKTEILRISFATATLLSRCGCRMQPNSYCIAPGSRTSPDKLRSGPDSEGSKDEFLRLAPLSGECCSVAG